MRKRYGSARCAVRPENAASVAEMVWMKQWKSPFGELGVLFAKGQEYVTPAVGMEFVLKVGDNHRNGKRGFAT